MELVYLWVEDYKNIHKQGFNFSPRFRCEYDADKKELTINENKDYINIFPDNINVTAIVGENGSGKSSIIELLQHLIFLNPQEKEAWDKVENKIKDLNKNLPTNFILVFFDKYEDKKLKYISTIKINTDISFLNEFHMQIYSNIDLKLKEVYQQYNWSNNKNFYKNQDFITNLINFMYDEKKIYKTSFFNPTTIILNTRSLQGSNLLEELKGINDIEKEFIDKKSKLITEVFITKTYHKYLYELDIKDNDINDEVIELVNYLNKFNLIEIYDSTKSYYYMKYGLDLGIEFKHLSHGEQEMIKLLLDLYSFGKKYHTDEAIIFLDEPTNSYHPDWQRKFIKILNEFIHLYNLNEKKKKFLISSHSPFILSDLPKENVIFLEKGKQVYPFEDGKQTFGANIHTLLSHGFFMKDGLMGEFAKNKISKILNFLNGKNKFIDTPINQIKPIIEIIGEDFLREKLLKMYNEKFPPSKKERIKELKEELERLENDKSKI